MSLARRLTVASLQLFSPDRNPKRGRAHRYETMFRTAVEVVKTSPRLVNDAELQERVAGHLLKRLVRVSGGYVPLYGDEQVRAASQFAALIVDDLYRQRCRGSKAQLKHEENALADAIYYLTDRQISQRIHDSKAKQQEGKSHAES